MPYESSEAPPATPEPSLTITTTDPKPINSLIRHLNPCEDARNWMAKHTDPQQAWDECPRGDWMLWLLMHTLKGGPDSDEKELCLMIACKCARLSLPHTKDPRVASIEALEKWCVGNATIVEVRAATEQASKYAWREYYADAAAYAAAYAAADAADAAADARNETLAKCADIVRTYFPEAPKVMR